MANIVTNTNVFDFMGTRSDVVSDRGADITTLITREQRVIESMLGRSVESVTLTDEVFDPSLGNCEISPNNSSVLFLKGKYRDMYSISAISDSGTNLDAVASYLDGNDYILNTNTGTITKISGAWEDYYYSIVISGKYGFVNHSDDSARDDVKQLLIEIVATKSGLWKDYVMSAEGRIEVTRNKFDRSILDRIKSLRYRSIL